MRRLSFFALAALLGCNENSDSGGVKDASVISADGGSSVDGGAPGVVVSADGGGSGDGGAGGDGGGSNVSADELYHSVVAKLRQCAILSQEGKYNYQQESFFFDKCLARCILRAPCEEVKNNVCANGMSNPMITACIAPCSNEFVTCSDTLRGGKRCDGVKDCGDGSDEVMCDFFTCKSGQRIRDLNKCDGESHCSDGSDEVNCFGTISCKDGKEPAEGPALECNGSAECSDGSDEPDCMRRGLLFACDGRFIPISLVCNLEVDCEDGTDEMQSCATRSCRP